jgi:alpha-tubulin suppressor-like RCC1 family protein
LGQGQLAIVDQPKPVVAFTRSARQLVATEQGFCARSVEDGAACWGLDTAGGLSDSFHYLVSPTALDFGQPVAQVAAGGGGTTCAVSNSGEVWCRGWIRKDSGVFDKTATPRRIEDLPSTIAQVAVGWGHTCSLDVDGLVWCWGRNDNGEVGVGSDEFFVSTPSPVRSIPRPVVQLSSGGLETCARTDEGRVWCWGGNYAGQLQDGTDTVINAPVLAALPDPPAKDISAGQGMHACAVLIDGTVWCWGRNDFGQLGDGTRTDRLVPTKVPGILSATAVSTGFTHTCAVMVDGRISCWGDGSVGQLGDGSHGETTYRANPVTVAAEGVVFLEVAVGAGATCARDTKGVVWCWGMQGGGLLGDGTLGFSLKPGKGVSCR